MFFAFGIVLLGYWLMWDGYVTLQQPTGPNPGGVGIIDLILPSRIAKVDNAPFWGGKSGVGVSGTASQGVVAGGLAAIAQGATSPVPGASPPNTAAGKPNPKLKGF